MYYFFQGSCFFKEFGSNVIALCQFYQEIQTISEARNNKDLGRGNVFFSKKRRGIPGPQTCPTYVFNLQLIYAEEILIFK